MKSSVIKAWLLSVLLTTLAAPVMAAPVDPVVYLAQKRLRAMGYDPGPVDGVMGARTKKALEDYQWNTGLRITNTLDKKTKKALGLTVLGSRRIETANLLFFDVPIMEYGTEELAEKLQKLNVRFDPSRHLKLYTFNGVDIHTGQVTRFLKQECTDGYDISIGEMFLEGHSIRSENYGDIFLDQVYNVLNKLHQEIASNMRKKSNKFAIFVCTAATF